MDGIGLEMLEPLDIVGLVVIDIFLLCHVDLDWQTVVDIKQGSLKYILIYTL